MLQSRLKVALIALGNELSLVDVAFLPKEGVNWQIDNGGIVCLRGRSAEVQVSDLVLRARDKL